MCLVQKQIKKNIFDLRLVESMDVKTMQNMEGQLCLKRLFLLC
jgi:hypothetical protein